MKTNSAVLLFCEILSVFFCGCCLFFFLLFFFSVCDERNGGKKCMCYEEYVGVFCSVIEEEHRGVHVLRPLLASAVLSARDRSSWQLHYREHSSQALLDVTLLQWILPFSL